MSEMTVELLTDCGQENSRLNSERSEIAHFLLAVPISIRRGVGELCARPSALESLVSS